MNDEWFDDGLSDDSDGNPLGVFDDPNDQGSGLPQPRIAIPGESDPGADGDDGRDGQAIGGGGQDQDVVDGTELGGKASRADLVAAAERESERDVAELQRTLSRPTGQHQGGDATRGRGGCNLAKSLGEAARGIGRSDNGGDGGATTVSLPDSLKEYVGSTAGRKQLGLKTLAGKDPAPKRRGSQVTGKTDYRDAWESGPS